MQLSAYAAQKRMAIYEDLRGGREPREGIFDPQVLKEARAKGAPQMGSTRYQPGSMTFEFIYPDAQSSATVLSVHLEAPERIVFLPVPSWVIENIWQGEIVGSFVFESEANAMVAEFEAELNPGQNEKHFRPQLAKRRE